MLGQESGCRRGRRLNSRRENVAATGGKALRLAGTVVVNPFRMRLRGSVCSLLFLSWMCSNVKCQLSDNTPPTMWLDRDWKISENSEVGGQIVQVHGSDNEDDELQYGLESKIPSENIPFRIDPVYGIVYLNESLKGKAGQHMSFYVTLTDGKMKAKTEVNVNILGVGGGGKQKLYRPSSPPSFMSYNFQHPPAPPIQMPHKPIFPPSYPEATNLQGVEKNSTHLLPVQSNFVTTTRATTEATTTTEKREDEEEKRPLDQPVKSVPDLTITLVPVISVCAVFLTVGIIALLFRKKICLGRTKGGKDDMRKDSGGIVVQEDLAMQQWRGPRAHSNRYEPWDREGPNSANPNAPICSPASNDRWEYPRHRLKFFNILGEGAFGQVWKCEGVDIDGKEGVSVVAVKTLKENASEKERSDLVSELQVMKMLEPHPNVVRLLGCCTEKDPIFLVMEFVNNGKLQSFLRNSRAERYYNNMHGQSKSLTSRDLTSFVYQVAKGMEFLAENGIIHRDLAARNVLISDEHVCKVADFGFARDVIDSHVYERKSEGRLPIRWMAPESLYDNIFSTKSDVWSFGVLIWEVVTLGSTPYPGLSAAEVMRKVRDGFRLDKPEHCRRELYNIMYYCWDKDPKQRPSFSECIDLLEKLLMTETDYIELERFPDHSYYNMLNLSDEKL